MRIVQRVALRLFLVSGISSLIIAASCGDDRGAPMIQLDLYYVNQSSKEITITHHARTGNLINSKVPASVIIPAGDTISFYSAKFDGNEDATISDFNDFIIQNRLYDSAYLLFDNERYMIFSKGELNENIFATENYFGEEIKDNQFKFFYRFTEEDYNNAQETDG